MKLFGHRAGRCWKIHKAIELVSEAILEVSEESTEESTEEKYDLTSSGGTVCPFCYYAGEFLIEWYYRSIL